MIKIFHISVPGDGRGFIGRACPSPNCHQYFKVRISDHIGILYCPYCGDSFSKESMLTREQSLHVHRVGAEKVKAYAISEIQNMFKRAFQGSSHITYKAGPRPTERVITPQYKDRKVDTELECSDCGTCFQVYGIFGYCPGCRCENLQVYDANWAIIKRGLDSTTARTRQLRHAYGDLVSTFEVICSNKAKRLGVAASNFQDLFDARKFFKEHAQVDILGSLSSTALLSLRRVFQKRHVCMHAGGVITERYVRKVPEDVDLLGTQVMLSVEELEQAAYAMRVSIGVLVRKIERPGK
jgi:Zn finger protein HypA/HybF involved in hydrogenase expression